jgi:CheY-like chemotaxis protein
VLVVVDEPTLRLLLRVAFESSSHSVTEAGNGAEGLVQLMRSRPELVVTDLMMQQMSGCELIDRLRALGDAPAVVVVSADHAALASADADLAIGKPFDPLDVVAAAEQLVQQQRDGSPTGAQRVA